MKIKSFRFRQIRTMILLVLLMGGCVGSGLYLRAHLKAKDTTPTVAYTQEDIDSALERYRNHKADDAAALVTTGDAQEALKATLLFYGVCDTDTVDTLLATLRKSGVSASFFLPADDLRTHAEMISRVYAAGYPVGVAADKNGDASAEATVENLCRAGLTMQADFGMYPSAVLMFSQPDEDTLYGAAAAYFDTVYLPGKLVGLEEISSRDSAETLVSQTLRGTLLCVPLSGLSAKTSDRITYLADALSQTDLASQAKKLIAAAPETASDPVSLVYTTERAVAFTFSGIGSDKELDGVLNALKTIHATGTFFVTERELEKNETQIRKILDAGNELGAAVNYGGALTEVDVLKSILREQETLRSVFGYSGEMVVRPATGSGKGTLAAAAEAGGFKVISAGVNVTSVDDARATDAETVLERVLPADKGVFRRGEIVHFQMSLYQSSDTLLGEMVQLCAQNRNIYTLRSVTEIMNNDEYTYTYPVPEDQILPEVKDKIYPGQLTGNVMAQISQRYIGIDWVNGKKFLPGFSDEEIKLLDKSGLVPNTQNMVFLSFDDWGTDENITSLLDVLKRHNAHATFFVRSNMVSANPNLLRAIAMDGHTIGSHTSSHFPLSNLDPGGKSYSDLSEQQLKDLRADLLLNYQELQQTVGDVAVDGKPALSLLFRPPTLAVSRAGLETVLDCGYTYSVSGSYTSQDYNATNREALLKALAKNTRSGAVLIMHMSDNSIYTSSALQGYFDYWEKKPPEAGPYLFCGLSEVLK